MRLVAAVALFVGLAAACRRDSTSIHADPAPSTSTKSAPAPTVDLAIAVFIPDAGPIFPANADGWIRFVSVDADGRVHLFPGSPLENQGFMQGKPEYEWRLKKGANAAARSGDRIEDGTGKPIVECRGDDVLYAGMPAAHLGPDGFVVGTRRITLGSGGVATVNEIGAETITLRYEGLVDGDACTAALLWLVVPIPAGL